MSGLKRILATTGIWMMVAVPYVLSFFMEGNGISLGILISCCISGFAIVDLWSKIFTWLYSDKNDTK